MQVRLFAMGLGFISELAGLLFSNRQASALEPASTPPPAPAPQQQDSSVAVENEVATTEKLPSAQRDEEHEQGEGLLGGGAAASAAPATDGGEAEGEEEEGECGFCLFMKGGPCGDEFVKWEECMDEAEKEKLDAVNKCWPVTQLLRKCMQMNVEYYGIILKAEEAMENALNVRENASNAEQPAESKHKEQAEEKQEQEQQAAALVA